MLAGADLQSLRHERPLDSHLTARIWPRRAVRSGQCRGIGDAGRFPPSYRSRPIRGWQLRMGARGRPARVFAMARTQNRMALLGAGPIGVLLVISLWLLIPAFLPRYEAARLPATLIVLGFVTMSAFTGYGNFLNVVGQQWVYLRAQLASASMGVGLMAAGALSLGPAGISLGAAVSYGMYGVLVSVAASRSLARLETISHAISCFANLTGAVYRYVAARLKRRQCTSRRDKFR